MFKLIVRGLVAASLMVALIACGAAGADGGGDAGASGADNLNIADLWGYYPFDSDGGSISFADASGNGRDAAVNTVLGQETPPSDSDRQSESGSFALHLADSNDGLEISSDASLQNATAISISMWILDGATVGRVIGQRYGGTPSTWETDIVATRFRYSYGGEKLSVPTTQFTSGWNHIVLVLQEAGPDATIYLNGAFDSEYLNTDIDLETTNPVRIGRTGLSGMVGQLDDIRIYTRALTAAEVTTLYNE